MLTKKTLALLLMVVALVCCNRKKSESEAITKVLEYDKFVGARAADILAPLKEDSEECFAPTGT